MRSPIITGAYPISHSFLSLALLVVLVAAEHDLFILDSSNLLKGDKEVWNLEPLEFSNFVERLLGSDTKITGSIVPTVDVFQSANQVVIFDFHGQNYKIMSDISMGSMIYSQVTRGDLHFSTHNQATHHYCYSTDLTVCPSDYIQQTIEDENSFLFSLPAVMNTLPSHSVLYIYFPSTFVPNKQVFETLSTQFPENTISMYLFSTNNHYMNTIKNASLHSLSEIFDYQIFSWTTFILIIVVVWVVIAISQLDYGEDIAGLYSKFHPESSKKDN